MSTATLSHMFRRHSLRNTTYDTDAAWLAVWVAVRYPITDPQAVRAQYGVEE